MRNHPLTIICWVAWLVLGVHAWGQAPADKAPADVGPLVLSDGVTTEATSSQTPPNRSPVAKSEDPTAAHLQLERRLTIDLRDVTLLEALFSVRDLAGINLVVGNEVEGTVNAAFTDAPLRQILDTLLIPRGYGYRLVSGSVVIMTLEDLGNQLPSMQTRIVPLIWSDATQLVDVLATLLSPQGHVHAIPKSNALMVVEYAERMPDLLTQIETLENAAREYAEAQRQQEAAAARDRAHSSDDAADRSADGGSGAELGGTAATGRGSSAAASPPPLYVQVFATQYVPANVLVAGLQPLLGPTGRLTALDSEDKIVALDTPENLERIAHALGELDRPRQQVRIWARIYDCGIEDLKTVGVNFSSGVNGSAMTADGTPNHSISLDTVTATLASPTNGVLTLSTINRLGTVRSIFQALESGDDSRLLADPNVVVMNHEQAQINIVTEVPYQQLTQGLNGGEIGTTAFREAGVQLTVTPHIANDNTIAMVINPTFSLLTGFTETDNAPIIDRREALTTVRVENLTTIVLGGLRQRTRIVEKKGIPGLSKVPYLGHLFRYRQDQARESELLVFITPELVDWQYTGTAREQCVADQLYHASESSPTNPIPFGYEVLMAERQAERQALHPCQHWTVPRPLVVRPGAPPSAASPCDPATSQSIPVPEIIGGLDP
ncbi:MAG: hypothetical protein KatS3mg111_3215 [Pirellulaceae bacterium]|nr:MAG: hypothetical protein KatS3mg111_3215 [Pirellulaceae bacterium]